MPSAESTYICRKHTNINDVTTVLILAPILYLFTCMRRASHSLESADSVYELRRCLDLGTFHSQCHTPRNAHICTHGLSAVKKFWLFFKRFLQTENVQGMPNGIIVWSDSVWKNFFGLFHSFIWFFRQPTDAFSVRRHCQILPSIRLHSTSQDCLHFNQWPPVTGDTPTIKTFIRWPYFGEFCKGLFCDYTSMVAAYSEGK